MPGPTHAATTAPPPRPCPRAFAECDAIVSFLAVGATVRLIAPLLTSKHEDPAVVCVDEALRYAVPVLGAHSGGGNDLARRVAAVLGAEPVVTTASDAAGGAGLDEFGADLGFAVEPGSDLAAVGAAILSGGRVTFTADREWPLPALPPNVVRTDRPEPGVPAVVVTDQKIQYDRTGGALPPPLPACGRGREPGRPRPRRSASSSTARWLTWAVTPLRSAPRYGGRQSGRAGSARGRGGTGLVRGHLPGQPARRGTGAPPERGGAARGRHAERGGGGRAARAGRPSCSRPSGPARTPRWRWPGSGRGAGWR